MKKFLIQKLTATVVAIGVLTTSMFSGTVYATEVGEQTSEVVENQSKSAGDSNILLLPLETVPEDALGAIAVEQLAGAVRLTYESDEMSKNAFDAFSAMGIACEYDTQVEMLDTEPEKVAELNPAETPTEDVEIVEDLKEEPVAVESAPKEKSVKVAVIDTGCDLNAIPGRIVEGIDISVTDVNGHGTLMAEIIASQTTEKVKILPIKAFDDNGYSTVGQVYDAIKSAIDLEADVINLSMSGAGTSQMLTNAINEATEKGITVVAAAGNDASDVAGYMPGNVDSAITVSATDRNEAFAGYSNFGEKIDYSAVGEIIKDQGTEDTADDVYYSGTSIAAAFVSGYAACIKDNNPEADILGTFDKYAKDLGEAGRDDYYGRGLLTLENISFDVNQKESVSDETEGKQEDSVDKSEDGSQKVSVSYNKEADGYVLVTNLEDMQNAIRDKKRKIRLKNNITLDTAFVVGSEDKFYLDGNNKTIKMGYEPNIGHAMFEANVEGAYLEISNVTIDCAKKISNAGYEAVCATRQGKIVAKNVTVKNGKDINGADPNKSHTFSAFKVCYNGTMECTNCSVVESSGIGFDATLGTNAMTCTSCQVKEGSVYPAAGFVCAKNNTMNLSKCSVRNCYWGAINSGKATIKDSDFYKNTKTNILWGEGEGASGSISGGKLYDSEMGIDCKSGTLTVSGTNIYDNTTGIANTKSITITGGGIYDNTIGIRNSGTVRLDPTSKTISIGKRTDGNSVNTKTHPNRVGIENTGTLTVQDSTTTDDKKVNICWNSEIGIKNTGKAIINYADIYNNGILSSSFNKATNSATFKYNTADSCSGITNGGSGTLSMNGSKVSSNQGKGITSGEKASVTLTSVQVNGNQGTGFINHGEGTIHSGNFYSNAGNGVSSNGTLKISNGNFYSNSESGVNSTGTLTVNGGSYYSNKSHGIAVGGGTANIYYGTFGTYSDDGGKTWKTGLGNVGAGIRTKKATTNVYGGVFFYNKNGLECQDGNLNLKYDGTNKRTIYVSDNTSNGLYSKGEAKNADGSVNTAGGNIVIDSNAKVDAHSNKSAAIYAGNKAQVSTGAGSYYNSPYGINVVNGGTVTLSGGDVYGNKTYGVYNNGTFTMSGGKVRDNDSNGTAAGGTKRSGIYNNQNATLNVSGGEISGNENGTLNWGTTSVSNGSIKANAIGIANEKSGTTTINGTNVSITRNARGIQNTADENGVKVIKATITKNTSADLSQSGKMFTISGANTKAETIELGVNGKGECEVVTLDGVPAESKKVVIKSNFDDEKLSSTIAQNYVKRNQTVGRPMFKCINTTPKAILDSGKLVLRGGQKTLMGNGTKKDAIMRPFKGSNMNESLAGGNIAEKDKYIVLSTKYAANYKVAEAIEGIKFILPDPEDIFWNEENAITLKPLKAIINGVEQVFDIAGWLKDGIGNAIEVGKKILFGIDESDRNHELVAQLGMCNLIIDGNGQSKGDNYTIEGFNCAKDKLPENTFEKEFKDNWYYTELDEQKQHETKYSYQGWSLSNDATYQSEGVYQPDGSLDYQKIMEYVSEHKEEMTYGENGFPNITLYAVWDKYPELEAKEIGFAEMELDQSLNLSDADSVYLDDKGFSSVLYERVVGTDDEDGVLTNGAEEKGVICEDSIQDLRAELLSFEHTGATTVTFKATDGVGNVTERRVRVWINRGNPIEEAYINRARVINRKYYDIGKEYADKLVEDNKNRPENEKIGSYEINVARMLLTGKLDRSDAGDAYIEAHKDENPALYYMTGFNHGGLMPIDMWYTDPEYRKCIEEAFDNRENDTPEYSWKFTHEQVLETQEYVETYGISTSEHQDALWNYFNKYKASFKKLK